jgi:ubiquitin C-terminal hydrolase
MQSMTSTHTGLANIGNTCYLNSAIQALRHVPLFSRYFTTDEWNRHRHPDRKGYGLAAETAALASTLSTATSAVVPAKFVKEFITFARTFNEDIMFGAQADAAEAVQILLDGLHTQQSREVSMTIRGAAKTPEMAEYIRSLESWSTFFRKEYSQISENFYGQTQTRIICTECTETITRYEPWSVLKAPIPGADKAGAPAPDLRACIAATFATETLEDYTCGKCSKRGVARIEHHMSRMPRTLILSLKRFTNQGAKVRARIDYDEHDVSFAEWNAWPTLLAEKNTHYRVIATIEHLGSMMGGHYMMRGRDSGGSWTIYDDQTCSPSPIGGSATPDTYMLFLEKIH